jgi:exodeoxyribonuclease-3
VDTFRHLCKEPGHYTWWSYRGGARAKNIGWRLDYHCVNRELMPRVKQSIILPDVTGSDHCPVAILIK